MAQTWGDVRRRGETARDVGRRKETWGDGERRGETWGDVRGEGWAEVRAGGVGIPASVAFQSISKIRLYPERAQCD